MAAPALAFALSLAVAAAACAAPAASPWSETEYGKVRLVAATTAVGDGPGVKLGLEFRMAPGWKVYWRSPGDAGYPPSLDWSRAENLADAAIGWPAPQRFTILGFETVGYEGAVTLPIEARLASPGRAAEFDADLDFLTCKDICVPVTAELRLALPEGPALPSPWAPMIAAARAAVPGDGMASGLAIDGARLAIDGTGGGSIVVEARSTLGWTHPDLFVETGAAASFARPTADVAADGRAILTAAIHGDAAALAGAPLTFTLVDGDRSMERALTPALVSGEAPDSSADTPRTSLATLLGVLAIAALGGLILNLMPCVLPVLSIKLLTVARCGGADRREVRASFLASSAGILASFLALAGALIALKSAGAAVGWGVQFQEPWFILAMILVCALFACNLWGLFEIATPQAVAAADARAGRVKGHVGHFFTGALATLLATPCSAPFLGAAIGFALARGPFEILVVFAALGLGLAAPYLAIAAAPGLATRLPRPGRWMTILRKALGGALALTAAWLTWIFAGLAGGAAAIAAGTIALAIMALLALRRARPGRSARIAAAAAAALAVAAFFIPVGPRLSDGGAPEQQAWRPFEPERIPALVAAGKTVVVNVTADWCLTCKVNERLVLAREPVASLLAQPDVVAMQADWTRRDESIARYLAGFGRYGIPFDAVYGPGAPAGEALPEVLTSGGVTASIERARGPAAAIASAGPR